MNCRPERSFLYVLIMYYPIRLSYILGIFVYTQA